MTTLANPPRHTALPWGCATIQNLKKTWGPFWAPFSNVRRSSPKQARDTAMAPFPSYRPQISSEKKIATHDVFWQSYTSWHNRLKIDFFRQRQFFRKLGIPDQPVVQIRLKNTPSIPTHTSIDSSTEVTPSITNGDKSTI